MKTLDFLWMLDVLMRYYPKYHSNDLLVLAEDVWKWVNGDLPDDSSTVAYLRTIFQNPTDAMQLLRDELQALAYPWLNEN